MANDATDTAQEFLIKRIYIKDFSFEAPEGADTFTNPWHPEVSIDIDVTEEKLVEDVYEVVLTLTVTANNAGATAFMIEILQGGIFTCKGFTDEYLHRVLHTVCPNILFPYAREAIDGMVLKASFPSLMIEPVNFDVIYDNNIGQEEDAS